MLETDFSEIWNNEFYQNARALFSKRKRPALNTACKHCALFSKNGGWPQTVSISRPAQGSIMKSKKDYFLYLKQNLRRLHGVRRYLGTALSQGVLRLKRKQMS